MSRILVADDEPDIRASVESALRDEGHKTLHAENGVRALSLLERGDIDLMVLDIYMPEKDGFDVLREGKKIHGLDMPPVIAMSGGGLGKPAVLALTMARALGVAAILYKPFSSAELVTTVRTSLIDYVSRE